MLIIDSKSILGRWNHYARNRFAFLTECCKTIDEVAAGGTLDQFAMATEKPETVKLIPALPHIKRFVDSWEQERLIAYLKSRRMVATWTMLALDFHLALFAEHSAIYVISMDQSKSNELLKRVVFMYENLPADFPKPKIKIHKGHQDGNPRRIDFPEVNSFIEGVSQEPDAIRGKGATLLHVEELAFWQWPELSWKAMLPTIQGGGKMAIVSTSLANSYFNRLVSDELEQERGQGSLVPATGVEVGLKIGSFPLPRHAEAQGQGMAGWRNPRNEFYVQLIHYTADPAKRRQQWYHDTRTGYTPKDWEQEYEINPENWIGKPVYSAFLKHWHVSPTPLQWIQSHRTIMLRMWDVGVHACVWGQYYDGTFHVFDSRQTVGSFEDNKRYTDFEIECSGLSLFIDECLKLSDEWFPGAVWKDVLDPSAWNKTITHEQRPILIFQRKGLSPIKGVQDPEVRQAAVSDWLMMAKGGKPAFLIDPSAKVVIDAFAGGYALEYRLNKLLANKGPFSHPANSIEYGCTRFTAPGSRREVQIAKAKAESAAFEDIMEHQHGAWRGTRQIDRPYSDRYDTPPY